VTEYEHGPNKEEADGIPTGYGLGRFVFGGSIPDGGWEFLSSTPHPDRLWGPPSFLSNGYRG
jgi:hypothetical protein